MLHSDRAPNQPSDDELLRSGRLPEIRGLSETLPSPFDDSLKDQRVLPVFQLGSDLVTRLPPERFKELLRLPYQHRCNLSPEVDLVRLAYNISDQTMVWYQSRFQEVYLRPSIKILITDSTGTLSEFDLDGGYPPGERIPTQMIYDRKRAELLVGYDDYSLFAVPEFDISFGSRRAMRRICA